MASNRVFFPQDALELWMADGRAEVAGDHMTLDGLRFSLATGLRIVSEVTGEPDTAQLVGKCKTLEQITELGGEHCADSVVLNDNAYEVVEGFLAQPEPDSAGAGDAAIAAAFSQE